VLPGVNSHFYENLPCSRHRAEAGIGDVNYFVRHPNTDRADGIPSVRQCPALTELVASSDRPQDWVNGRLSVNGAALVIHSLLQSKDLLDKRYIESKYLQTVELPSLLRALARCFDNGRPIFPARR
jgi:hypothetical protein